MAVDPNQVWWGSILQDGFGVNILRGEEEVARAGQNDCK